MMKDGYIIDGIKWVIAEHPRRAIPLCQSDYIVLSPFIDDAFDKEYRCEECGKIFSIPRTCLDEREFILRKLDSKVFRGMKYLNLDDEAIPIAEDKASTKDGKYFVTARLMESKVGKRLVVYAGEKGRKEKTQIFVEPDIKRLAFDQKDLHPTDIFTKIEATFKDKTKATISNMAIKK